MVNIKETIFFSFPFSYCWRKGK